LNIFLPSNYLMLDKGLAFRAAYPGFGQAKMNIGLM
jgi:hypothetical protein